MHRDINHITAALQSIYGERLHAIYSKSKNTLPKEYANTFEDDYQFGTSTSCPAIVLENNVQFEINWETGQKTGFFLDQRDNRKHMTQYVKGRKVLNAFSYSAGFSVYALKAGAAEVHARGGRRS